MIPSYCHALCLIIRVFDLGFKGNSPVCIWALDWIRTTESANWHFKEMSSIQILIMLTFNYCWVKPVCNSSSSREVALLQLSSICSLPFGMVTNHRSASILLSALQKCIPLQVLCLKINFISLTPRQFLLPKDQLAFPLSSLVQSSLCYSAVEGYPTQQTSGMWCRQHLVFSSCSCNKEQSRGYIHTCSFPGVVSVSEQKALHPESFHLISLALFVWRQGFPLTILGIPCSVTTALQLVKYN